MMQQRAWAAEHLQWKLAIECKDADMYENDKDYFVSLWPLDRQSRYPSSHLEVQYQGRDTTAGNFRRLCRYGERGIQLSHC